MMSNDNGEGHHQPMPQPVLNEEYIIKPSSGETIGNAWATRLMLVAMSSHLGCLDEFEKQVKHLLGSLQEKGLVSGEHELNKDNFPLFFQGIESAHNNFLHMIDWVRSNK